MGKRAFIIHCWGGLPSSNWYFWLGKKLEEKGYVVSIPEMPDTENPKMGPWLKKLSEIIGDVDKDCYFVGHSLGCIAIMRYLETLSKNKRVGGAVLVAGFSNDLGLKEIKSFFKSPFQWEKIKSHCNFVAINSDNDPFVPLSEGHILSNKLGAKLIKRHNMEHFSGGLKELPIALDALLEMNDNIKTE
ncbi:MAG: serine hydrolase family protein [Candidatus Altiarchaeota archaeon]|nr:serine hydrolase family protein [Candidatus Altiarchaeota archaeon]